MSCPRRDPLEEEVLERIRPSRGQVLVLSRLYSGIRGVLEGCVKHRGLDAVIEPVGSYAKGTMLSDKWEIDVFILFRGVSDEWITRHAERLLLECLSPRYPVVLKYSQHPYVTVSLMGLEADVVPAILVDRPRRRGLGVERTPFHTRYVASRLSDCQRDDVRLLKSFLKGIGVYGAEQRVRGFSGYLAELLVIAYGSFRRVLEEASRWRPPVYVDPEGSGDLGRLRRRYPESPLIVVDPVDPERNAAAAVSMRSLAVFVEAARLYLESPSRSFFHAFPLTPGPGVDYAVIRVECRAPYHVEPPENVWGKLRRAASRLEGFLRSHGFKPVYSVVDTDEASTATIEVAVEALNLPPFEYVEGPYPWDPGGRPEKFIAARLSRGEPVWVAESGRLAGLRRRRYTSALEAAEAWLEETGSRLLKGSCRATVSGCPGGSAACKPTPGWLLAARRPRGTR